MAKPSSSSSSKSSISGGNPASVRVSAAVPKKKLSTIKLTLDASQRKIEAARRALQAKVAKDRWERFVAFKESLKSPARISTRAEVATAPARVCVLAEGDSWFDYPFEGGAIPRRLEEATNIRLLNLAHAGDEVREILGVEQRKRVEGALSDPRLPFDALLFSGGGNDLVGDPFCLWLRRKEDGMSPAAAIDPTRLKDALDLV